jgi:hypothetical protein
MTKEETLKKEMLKKFQSSKFIRAGRSNGYIKPTTMKIVDFSAAIGKTNTVLFWSDIPRMWDGIYLVADDGTVQNVNLQIMSLYRAGFLEKGAKRGSLKVVEGY